MKRNPLQDGCWIVRCSKYPGVEIVILTTAWLVARSTAAKYFNCHINDLRLQYAQREAIKLDALRFTVAEALEVAGKLHGK